MNLLKNLVKKRPLIGRFCEIPASWVDSMEQQERTSFISAAKYFLLERLTFIVFFPILIAVDLVFSLLAAIGNYALTFITSDKFQDGPAKRGKEFATLFSKNLIGLLLSPLGLISPKLLTFFFVPHKEHENQIKSGGSLYQADVSVVQPTTQEEIIDLVKQANQPESEATLMAVGAGRSQGMQYFPHPDGKPSKKCISIDMSQFNTINIDEGNKTAIVDAGAIWADVQKAANKKKLALKVMQASNVFSLGGSMGTNIHGWDHKSGNLANVIDWVDIVNPQGEVERIEKYLDGDETRPNPRFGQIIGGFGLFGVVLRAQIRLADNEMLTERGTEVALDDYTGHFRNKVENDPKVRMHLYRLSLDPKNLLGSGVAVDYVKEDDSAAVKTPNLHKEAERGTRFDRVMISLARKFGFIRKFYWKQEHDRLLRNDSAATSTNEIMQPPINAMFNESVSESEWLQEYFLPETELAGFTKALGQLLMKNNVSLLNCSVRFVKQDKFSTMGYATEGDRFAVVLCFNQSLKMSEIIKTRKWVRESFDMVTQRGGSFYLPYQQFASKEQFTQSYPKAAEFEAAKEQADPNGVFRSGLYQQYIAAKDNKPNYFKQLINNEQAKAHFKGFLSGVLKRVDSDKLYGLLGDICSYYDTHEEIYKELLRRIPEIMPNGIKSLHNILSSLSSIKADLAGQARALLPEVHEINGLVEIGYPGRFVKGFKQGFKVNGPITAVYEAQSATDYIQTGFPRPYDKFVKLDYDLPDLSSIANNSADVVTCYVGLHHFPPAKLDQFLAKIRNILRPGGHFLLVDHDAKDDESMMMAHMAHSIFNAVTGASVEAEMAETREFRPMSEWQALLTKHGLADDTQDAPVEMIRAGDPSRNMMKCFVKKDRPSALASLSAANSDADEDSELLDMPHHPSPLAAVRPHAVPVVEAVEQQQSIAVPPVLRLR